MLRVPTSPQDEVFKCLVQSKQFTITVDKVFHGIKTPDLRLSSQGQVQMTP